MQQQYAKAVWLIGAGLVAASMSAFAANNEVLPQAPLTPIPLAIVLDPAKGGIELTVTSSVFSTYGQLPLRYTGYAQNESPPLSWTAGPEGTQSYVVLLENPDVRNPTPVYLWVLYNVPASVTQLPAHLASTAELQEPAGAMQGGSNNHGYHGPNTPKGKTHPYHFQVFALDEKLSLSPQQATFPVVVESMNGHVLASGEIVAVFSGPANGRTVTRVPAKSG
jgi:Raf kinase inhibitor-like YbhB/YbcL family protein